MNTLEKFGNIPIDASVLYNITDNYKFQRNKIAAMEKSGEILRLKKNLYVVSGKTSQKSLSKELIANHLYGISYISLETALVYYGMIPERVYSVCSMTTKRAKIFSTPLGYFVYKTVPIDYFSIGIRQEIINNSYAFFIATPTKAICDMIIATPNLRLQSVKAMLNYLIEDLRIDFDVLETLDREIVKQCVEVGKKKTELTHFLRLLQNGK